MEQTAIGQKPLSFNGAVPQIIGNYAHNSGKVWTEKSNGTWYIGVPSTSASSCNNASGNYKWFTVVYCTNALEDSVAKQLHEKSLGELNGALDGAIRQIMASDKSTYIICNVDQKGYEIQNGLLTGLSK
jgi:hypothetical protein